MKKLILISVMLFLVVLSKVNAQATFQSSFDTTFQNGFISTNEVSVLQTFDGDYCIGGSISKNNGDIYLMKLNSLGDTLWTRTFGGDLADVLYSVEQTLDSGFILAGQTRSFGMGNTDAYLIRTDARGNLIWSKTYGGVDFDWFSCIQRTEDNGFIACGSTSGIFYLTKIDLDGNILWTKSIAAGSWASSIQQTFDKGYIITGYAVVGDYHICLVKTDSVGNVVWSKISASSLGEGGQCVKQCSDSSYVITGYTNDFGAGAQDAFLLKVDTSGNFKWMKTYGGIWEDIGYHLEQTSDNGFVISGRTESFGPNIGTARNVYLVKTNPIGDVMWTKAYGSVINNGYCVKQTIDNGYIVVSNPSTLQVIKTDSLGHTGGCNEYNTNTIESSVSPALVSRSTFNGSVGISNNANTITGQSLITMKTVCPATTVDVKLLSFVVSAADCKTLTLKWQTAQELNNKGFEIESSIDGYQFNKIAFVIGRGINSGVHAYSYNISGLSKKVYYFRLKQIDFDGHFSYSAIVSSKNICDQNTFYVFPNPIKNTFQITGLTSYRNNIQIFSITGIKILEWINTSRNNFHIPNLPKGVYIIRINNSNTYKILKE